MADDKNINRFVMAATKELVGKTIAAVRYLTDEEMNAYGWYSRCPVIFLEDGSAIIPMSDEEGNEGGVFEILSDDRVVIPRM